MSADILPFRASAHLDNTPSLEDRAHLARVSQAFARKVDYNIRSALGIGLEYLLNVLDAVSHTILDGAPGQYTDADTLRRVNHEITNCTIFDCANLIHKVDGYLEKIHVQESPEKEFFLHIRNIAFMRKKMLASEGREK